MTSPTISQAETLNPTIRIRATERISQRGMRRRSASTHLTDRRLSVEATVDGAGQSPAVAAHDGHHHRAADAAGAVLVGYKVVGGCRHGILPGAMNVGMYASTVDRKLYRVDLAGLAGIRPDSLGRANPPPPDGHDLDAGHARPWWWESTARQWLANRPTKGWARGRPRVGPGERRAG